MDSAIQLEPTADPRDRALCLLRRFCRDLLPGTLHRISLWKGLPQKLLESCRADIEQDLALDCLCDPGDLLALDERERNAHWMRQVERLLYHMLVRPQRTRAKVELDELPDPAPDPRQRIEFGVPIALPGLVLCKNGRCNLEATARARGTSVAEARHLLADLGARLGHDPTENRYWELRLADALTGLGADLLAKSAQRDWLPVGLPAPDPERRLRRIHRLLDRFAFHDMSPATRRLTGLWRRIRDSESLRPRMPIEQAVALAPDRPELRLWLFEAALDEGDLAGALSALRLLPRTSGIRGRAILARARVLECRGRREAAVSLLARAFRRWPDDVWLGRARLVLTAPPRARAPARPPTLVR